MLPSSAVERLADELLRTLNVDFLQGKLDTIELRYVRTKELSGKKFHSWDYTETAPAVCMTNRCYHTDEIPNGQIEGKCTRCGKHEMVSLPILYRAVYVANWRLDNPD